MPVITLPAPGDVPWNLNPAIETINDAVDDHEDRIEVLENGEPSDAVLAIPDGSPVPPGTAPDKIVVRYTP